MRESFRFPRGFLWGAATSAHQVEGENRNDWTEWERKNARRLAQSAKDNPPPGGWPGYILKSYPNPLQEENYISGRACDHYHRFREDFDIAKQLGHNAHRFSIEWSRIEPEEGKFDEREIEHYREVIRALRERGLEPFVTLWHYTLPIWVAQQDGWMNPNAPQWFVRYAERMAVAFKDLVKFWVTQNEPETVARNSYLIGARPPQKKNFFLAYSALRRMCRAHVEAYRAMKAINPSFQIGIAETLVYFDAYKHRLIHRLALIPLRWWRNNPIFSSFVAASDYIGLEYYFHTRVRLNPWTSQWGFQYNENAVVSDLGWELYPQGLLSLLHSLKRYKKPIYILEHGLADATDQHRSWYIRESLKYVAKAIGEDVDVRGYLHWSFLDNFEWQGGFWPRFGLVEVDYKTLVRKIRPSAWEYKKIIESGLA